MLITYLMHVFLIIRKDKNEYINSKKIFLKKILTLYQHNQFLSKMLLKSLMFDQIHSQNMIKNGKMKNLKLLIIMKNIKMHKFVL